MPTLDRITVYPIKSLAGRDLAVGALLPKGALMFDRRYALVDQNGKFVNAKRCAAMHRIRATYGDDLQTVVLQCDDAAGEFDLSTQQREIAIWCSRVLDIECRLVENAVTGFPDDTDAPGATWISTASLQAVANWFDGLDLAEVRRRFRCNFEVGGTAAFWEDSLVASSELVQRFQCSATIWQGRGICQRCPVPSRNSNTGEVTPEFAREFSRQRESALPNWSPREHFDHMYRLGVNSIMETNEQDLVVRLGDDVELIELF